MDSQPFEVDFLQHGSWVTASGLKSIWEKVFLFTLKRVGNKWLMPIFLYLGFTDNEVWIHQQVLYYLDVMDAREQYLTSTTSANRRTPTPGQHITFFCNNPQSKISACGYGRFCNCSMLGRCSPWANMLEKVTRHYWINFHSLDFKTIVLKQIRHNKVHWRRKYPSPHAQWYHGHVHSIWNTMYTNKPNC